MSKFKDKNKENVPEDYFVNFGDKLKDRIHEEELFSEEAFPILNSIGKANDFAVPSAYFDQLNIQYQQVKKRKNHSLYLSLAAAASILVCIVLFTLSDEKINPIQEELAAEDNIELDYLIFEDDSFETAELVELLDQSTAGNLSLDDIDDETILEYLMDESDHYDLVSVY